MSDLTEENGKKSNSAPGTSAEGNVSPKNDGSVTRKQLQLEKQLKSLAFQNPGPRIAEFNPEIREQKKRALMLQMKKVVFKKPKPAKKYDRHGRLLCNNFDLCDCLEESCMGCFYPCPKCNSKKCGVECRCNRKWAYEKIETEDGNMTREFPFDD